MALSSPRLWESLAQASIPPAEAQPAFDWRDPGLVAAAFARTAVPHPEYASRLLTGPGEMRIRPQASFRVARELSSATGRHVLLQQQFEGHDVVGATAKLHLELESVSASGRAFASRPLRLPRSGPVLGPDEAAAIALRDGRLPTARLVRQPELVVLPEAQTARWAFLVRLVSDHPIADLHVYVDAGRPSILLAYNVACALDGTARVYPVNPVRTPELEVVSLQGLADPPGDALAGAAVSVQPARPPALTSSARDFACDPRERRFDQPSCFYHLQRGLDYYASLFELAGLASPPFRPVRAIVSDPRLAGNGYYVPDEQLIRLGGGSRPVARSAEIVVHELGHAVTNEIARLGNAMPNGDSRGLAEGFSDYFACSMFDSPIFGDYVAPGRARNCADPSLRFRRAGGEEHEKGAVWAAFLWDVRGALGPTLTDRVVAQSIYYLGPGSSFRQAAESLVASDARLAGATGSEGPNAGLLRRLFQARA